MPLKKNNELNEDKGSADYQKIYDNWLKTNRSIRTILDCSEESIFFLNSDLNIEGEYSKYLENAFNQEDLKNKNFLELLEDRVPDSVVKDAEEYLQLMFRDELDVDIINELNPLSEIELLFEDQTGLWSSSKFFSFIFKRIYEKGRIVKLFSTVKDVTERKNLSIKLKELQEKTEKQLEWLANIMHVEPILLKEFLDVTEFELNQIDIELKNSRIINNFKSFLNKIQRTINQMHNNAALLKLSFFNSQIKKFEEEIMQLKDKEEISGSDFIPSVFQLSKLKLMIDEIKVLMQRFKYFKLATKKTDGFEGGLLVRAIDKLVKDLSKELGRNIIFKYEKFKSSDIPISHQRIVREFLVILTRFSIYYGIESPEERKQANKNPVGTLVIETFVDRINFGFKLKHDGRLVKIERLLQKTVESADAVIFEPDKMPENNQLGSEVVRFLFMPSMATSNFSEAEYSKAIFKDMELVKKKLKMHGGKIKITFSSEQHCEYTISFFKN